MHATPQQSFADIVRPQKPDLLTAEEAARFLGMSPGTLAVWRTTGRYNLPFVKVGNRVRYERAALAAWLARRTRTTGATE